MATDTSYVSDTFQFIFKTGYNPDSTIDNPIHFKITLYIGSQPFWSDLADFVTGIENNDHTIPARYELMQNYPNPFNPQTTISYQLAKKGFVDLSVFNIRGQMVASLVSEQQLPGTYEVVWDAQNFASGVYLYRLITSDGFESTKKLLLLK